MATVEAKYAALGRKLRSARKRKGISQENLAAAVGITRRHLIRLEFGQHLPSIALRKAIADMTGVDAETFRVAEDEPEDDSEDDLRAAVLMFAELIGRVQSKSKEIHA